MVGRALNGLEERINRHFRRNKRNFWHIDYLLEYSKIFGIIYGLTSHGESECKIAFYLVKKFKSVRNFDSSNCRCRSHLFFNRILVKEGRCSDE